MRLGMKKVLGIDLGGTSAKFGVINQYGEIEQKGVVKNDMNNLLPNLVNQVMASLKE